MPGSARIGIGGWTFAPWRGVFYPRGLAHAQELGFATRSFSTLEINGTFYSTFRKATWRKWRDAAPDSFVYAVKASRFCTHRKVLADAGPSVAGFLSQGLTELGPKLGPINWQFAATKRFDPADFDAFLKLLPKAKDGIPLRHAIEVRHPSFDTAELVALARRHRVAIVYAEGKGVPKIDEDTAGFRYARLMTAKARLKAGLTSAEIARYAALARKWQRRGDAFLYMISAAKVRNPAAALALAAEVSDRKGTAHARIQAAARESSKTETARR
ncbi:MAG: DUF72 domain-containing protein [Hyphomicrobiaceae bacterium]